MVGQSRQSVTSFYSRSLSGRVGVAVRKVVGRDKPYQIGRYPVTLPATHKLPWFQSVFPAYDRYAQPLLASLCDGARSPLMIDIGANVGDTALLALDAVEVLSVVAVEGDERFLNYLRKNTGQVSDRVEIIPEFMSIPDGASLGYRTDGSTGGFVLDGSSGAAPQGGASAAGILQRASKHDLVIWKTDTDGLDIELLLSSWEEISRACKVIWFEFDPRMDVRGGKRAPELAQAIATSDRTSLIFDNSGRHMMTVDADAISSVLQGLTEWLLGPASPGQVDYLDIWTVDRSMADRARLGLAPASR